MSAVQNRREFDRFSLPPMYTHVVVRRGNGMQVETLSGHAYDVSEGGLRLEVDEELTPGELLSLHIGLPGEDVDVFASARVVWTSEPDDDPGPRRSAVKFADFSTKDDRRRLVRFLSSGLVDRAA
jgi:c-di-GMP-binding flagellar brake protein YcgR